MWEKVLFKTADIHPYLPSLRPFVLIWWMSSATLSLAVLPPLLSSSSSPHGTTEGSTRDCCIKKNLIRKISTERLRDMRTQCQARKDPVEDGDIPTSPTAPAAISCTSFCSTM